MSRQWRWRPTCHYGRFQRLLELVERNKSACGTSCRRRSPVIMLNSIANAPPVVRSKRIGRPRKKGRKLPAPAEVVQQSSRTRLTVDWYGGGQRGEAGSFSCAFGWLRGLAGERCTGR